MSGVGDNSVKALAGAIASVGIAVALCMVGAWALAWVALVCAALALVWAWWSAAHTRATHAPHPPTPHVLVGSSREIGASFGLPDVELAALETALRREVEEYDRVRLASESLTVAFEVMGSEREDRILSRIQRDCSGGAVFGSMGGEGWVVPLDELAGNTVEDVFPEDWPSLEPFYTRALAGEFQEYVYQLKRGGPLWWTRIHPVPGVAGEAIIDCVALPETWVIPNGEVTP